MVKLPVERPDDCRCRDPGVAGPWMSSELRRVSLYLGVARGPRPPATILPLKHRPDAQGEALGPAVIIDADKSGGSNHRGLGRFPRLAQGAWV